MRTRKCLSEESGQTEGGGYITVIGHVAQIQASFWMLKAWACHDLPED